MRSLRLVLGIGLLALGGPALAQNHPPGHGTKTTDFQFADISGSKTPLYLRRFVFTLVDPDHHTEDWTFLLAGDKRVRAHFDLKRAARSASAPSGQ